MAKRRWNQFPQTYEAIVRHFLSHSEEVWIEGLRPEDVPAVRLELEKFIKAIRNAHDEDALKMAAVARELWVDVGEDSIVVRANPLALGLWSPEVTQDEQEITHYEGEDSFDPAALEEMLRQRNQDNG